MPLRLNSTFRKAGVFVLLILPFCQLYSQQNDTTASAVLPDLVIKAFNRQSGIKDIAAGVAVLRQNRILSSNPQSIVQAVNTLAGVRMDERSPTSYRFNIRGSSIRSPFGVRNVKMYYNDIPITDPGGITFLNQFPVHDVGSLVVIKGPGSSLYGAGTGGVVLIESPNADPELYGKAEVKGGSYDYYDLSGSIHLSTDKSQNRLGYQRQSMTGYRSHSYSKRQTFSWTGHINAGEKVWLKPTVVLGDLYYETPGALTLSEYQISPRSARPATGSFPGSEAARASIRQRHFLAGISGRQELTGFLTNQTVLYGMFTELTNPNIRSYEYSSLPHFGGRTIFDYRPAKSTPLLLQAGMEWQKGISSLEIHKNRNGSADSLRSTDRSINTIQSFFFQSFLDAGNWSVAAGLSSNNLAMELRRYEPALTGMFLKKSKGLLAPRISLMRKWSSQSTIFNVFASVSKGYSPPAVSDLFPSGGEINMELDPETGWNYEIGVKTGLFRKLYIECNAFYFALDNTIALRKTAANADYYVNAGKTDQRGIETTINYHVANTANLKLDGWLAHTFHHFKYRSFQQGNDDYSGNRLPGIAPHTISTGMNAAIFKKLSIHLNYFYSDRIYLNDANQAQSKSYHLMGIQLGYGEPMNEYLRWKLLAGVDNLFNSQYSLGNDINAFGGRYYNAAPERNFYLIFRFDLTRKK